MPGKSQEKKMINKISTNEINANDDEEILKNKG